MVKSLPRLCLLLLAFVLLGIAVAMAWVSYIPRDVTYLIPRVEASLNTPNAPVHVQMGQARIDWRKWEDFGRISIADVRLTSDNNTVFAQLPSMQVKLSPVALLMGSVGIDWVIIPSSNLVLTSTPERQLMLGFAEAGAAIPLSRLYEGESTASSGPVQLPFNNLLLENANIAIRDPSGKLLLATYKSELAFTREAYGFQGALRLNFTYRDQVGSTQSLVRYYKSDKAFTVASRLVNVPIGLICGIAGDCGPLKTLRGAITGKAAVNVEDGAIADAQIVLSGERLRFTQEEWFAEPLSFTRASVSASITDNMRHINVEAIDLKNDDLEIVASAKASKKKDGWYLGLVAKQNGLYFKNLYKYWPVSLAPGTREWVTGGITQGFSTEAVATVNLTPADMEADVLPDDFLKASINVNNATVKYLPGLAPVKAVDGLVHFTGSTMRADVGGGTLLSDSQMKRALVFVPDLNHPNVPMETKLTLNASAADVADLLKHKAFTFDDSLKLERSNLSGRLNGTLNLDFEAFSDTETTSDSFDVSGVNYAIDVALENISQKRLMGAYDISGFSGALKADADGFSVVGKGNMNNSPLDISVKQQSGGAVHVGAKGAMTRENIVALGMPDRKEIGDGVIGFDAGFILGKDSTILESVALNLKDVALTVADISWTKARGVPSNVTITPLADKPHRYTLSHKGGELSVSGEMALNPKTSALESLTLSRVISPSNDFALSYAKQGRAMRIKLTGQKLDNSASFTSESEPQGENQILANFPSLHLTLDIAELVLAPQAPLRNLKGVLDCASGPCELANITASIGEGGTLIAHISSQSGVRKLDIKASDAGALLRALDVTDKVNKGELHFDGAYNAAGVLRGALDIRKFNVKQSQVLARLFSVASLSGLSNLLTGSGIDFEKLKANVTHERGIFTLKEARANGASVGYTTEGTINTRDATLNLKGVLVPAYALNSIVGNIPLIGAIAGGEGEGLISFTYTVKGKYADPEVSVNPLSGLTPGFLRGIFDAGDGEATPASANGKGPATPLRERR
ncbi:MAG: hypothetical protein C0436_04040 [Alphaproteobacteria bacterium]|nr:hypothetical protein [Alphaproteobacteria bacterium]